LAGLQDLDKNGIREIAIGAPGDNEGGLTPSSGSVYIFFLKRKRFHGYIPSFIRYVLSIALPFAMLTLICCTCTGFFFWYFRRKADIVETIVKKSGMEIAENRVREKKVFNSKVYVDSYDA